MFKLSKADTGASRVCRDIAGYALGAAIVMAGAYVVLGSIVACESRPVRPSEAPAVYADSGYSRSVDRAARACQRVMWEVAESMGERVADLSPAEWQAVYWDCLVKLGATT